MNKKFAKILSVILHPLLIPTIGLIIILNSGSRLEFLPSQAKRIILLIVFVSTAILPLTFIPFYVFQKIIKNVQMDNSKERLIPFLVTSVLYAFCYYLLLHLGVPKTIVNFILVGALISISFILNVNLEYYIVASILFSGILGYSRLTLGKHKQYQIYTGWILGLTLSIVILFIF